MAKPHLKVLIAGHVDHGKSTLIGRLLLDTRSIPDDKLRELKKVSRALGKDVELAYLTDQLEEERRDEMTIDTAQIYFRTAKAEYIIIDAPGHAEFIKNMLTGATQADAAILIVDITQGIKEQTLRHAHLIDMLGIKDVIVAVNKIDLADNPAEMFAAIKEKITGCFAKLRTAPALIIPASAREGINISRKGVRANWHEGPTLIEALDVFTSQKERDRRVLRLPVQDIYTIDGKKIIVGQILSGKIATGQKVMLLPSMQMATVAGIKKFSHSLRSPAKAMTGESIGLLLKETLPLKRGDIIAPADTDLAATDKIRGEVFWMADKPLRVGDILTIKCGTQTTGCAVTSIQDRADLSKLNIIASEADRLETNEGGRVGFCLQKPIVVENFHTGPGLGRFTLEKDSEIHGAGIIT